LENPVNKAAHVLPVIASASNDILVDTDGRRYLDLMSANGAAMLGHTHPAVVAAVARQLDRVWLTGAAPTPPLIEATAELESWFPPAYRLAGLYSTGMEAAEFALRVARKVTGRAGAAGFEHSMHGKSLATASLAWDNGDGLEIPGWHRLPFLPRCSEAEALAGLEGALAGGQVGAVLVETLQGSGGGRHAGAGFYAAVQRCVQAHGALLVLDEILTGFYRTGVPFRFLELGLAPDIVLFGKACGNGFPVAGAMVARRHPLVPAMLPGSTYAGNQLACAAVAATLRTMRALDLGALTAAIAGVIRAQLGWLDGTPGFALRGQGALWVVESPDQDSMTRVVAGIFEDGICVGQQGRRFRIMPAATIDPGRLESACRTITARLKPYAEKGTRA
jgi:4-aminobutyrate aminotransferase-like enzyme